MAENFDPTDEEACGKQAVDALKQMLSLQELSEESGEQRFMARTLNRESPRIYGGQVLAQAIMAASHAAPVDRPIHSIHGYFLRPGDIDQELTLGVQHLNDGRSFSTRRVQAYQDQQPIFSAIASFQEAAKGPEHSSPMPQDLPSPESLPKVSDLVGHVPLPIARAISYERPFDLRHVEEPLWLSADPEKSPTTSVWFKTFDALPDDPTLHKAAIAYASDYLPVEPGLRAHGKHWLEQGMKVASLDHAMWFHRPARADEWLLYVLESPSAQDARSLATGKIFTAEGDHVATVAQETMLRLPEYREVIL